MTDWTARAADEGADLICFPELAITGYPPEDLVLRPGFVDDNLAALDGLAASTAGSSCAVMVGFVDRSELGLHNAAALLRDGRVAGALPQDPAPELRRVRREALLRAGNRGVLDPPGIVGARPLGLRGRVARRRAVRRVRAHASADRPEHQRVALPPRQGRRATGDLSRPRAADRRVDRLRERGRRPGRARVRRRLDGGLARRRDRAPGPRCSRRTSRSSIVQDLEDGGSWSTVARAGAAVARRAPRRSTARWCSASGTTCARTASARS